MKEGKVVDYDGFIGEIESEEELPSFQDLGLENAVDIEDNAE